MYENDITDVPKSDAAVETTNTPDDGADATPKGLVETESKQTTTEQEIPSSPEVGGDMSETTLEKDSPLEVTSKSLETDSTTKEEPIEDTTVPATVIEIKEPPSAETSNVAENGEDTHTPIEETEESTSSELSQSDNTNLTTTLTETQESITQEKNVHEAPAEISNEDNLIPNEGAESSLISHQGDTSITTTSAETAETQEIQPQEVSIHEVAAEVVTEDKLLPNEEGTATQINMEPEGSSLSHLEDDSTLTTTATEIQKSPSQEQSTYEADPEVATKEGTANLTNMDAEGNLLSQQEDDTTLPTTAAETQENPHPVELKYENVVKVENEEGTANLTTMEAGGSSLSHQESDTSLTTTATEAQESPPQEESICENDGENIASAGEAGGTPEVGHFYVEGSVVDNIKGSAQKKKKRRRRNLKIAIGFVLVIIIGLGIGIGFLVASKDDDTPATTTTMSTTTIATTVEETTTPMPTTETEGTTTQIITTPTTVSPSFISKHEMRNFTSGFIDLDENNKGSQVKVEHGNKTQEGVDQTYEPLLKFKKNALKGPTLETFVALLKNYTPAVDIEDIPSDELVKEFLDAVMDTSIMDATEEFMRNKTFDGSLRDYLQQIWFTPYSRSSNGVFGSSGFEHTFVGEQKDGHVRGFQNWVNFGLQEQNGTLKYKGWKKSIALKTRTVIPNPLVKKGEILELNFEWQNNTRSLDFMFIGTSPELELALYTLCYWAKLGEKCHVQLNNHRFVIHTSDYGGLGVVGSAYPDVSNTVI